MKCHPTFPRLLASLPRAVLRVATGGIVLTGVACSGASLPPDAGTESGASADGGVPADAGAPPPISSSWAGRVALNEVTSSGGDLIELVNLAGQSVDLGGWWIADSGYAPQDPLSADHQYWFPAGTTLDAGAYLVLEKDVNHGFGLSSDGDAVRLFDADGGLVDDVSWGAGEAATSYCRQPSGTGAFVPCEEASFGAENPAGAAAPSAGGESADGGSVDGGDVNGASEQADGGESADAGAYAPPASLLVINEVRSSGDDEIELYNRGTASLDLSGYAFHDQSYIPDDATTAGQRYEIPAGTSLDAGGFLVFVKGTHHSFGLGGADGVTLTDAAGQVIDSLSYPEGAAALSYCRLPDGEGPFQSCAAATFGAANTTP